MSSNIKAPIHNLMKTEMSRKEFLTTAGFGIISLIGLSSIVHLLTGKKSSGSLGLKNGGYGSGSYNR